MSAMPAVDTATPQEVSGGNTVEATIAPVVTPVVAQARWPKEIELVVSLGSKRIGLTVQSFLVRDVLYRTFDKIRASLLFHNSFTDAHDVLALINESLVSAAAECPEPGSLEVHECLLADVEYMGQMQVLVSPVTWNFSITNSIVASHLHFPLPGFGKRALQCYDIFCILDHWRPGRYRSTCSETEGRLQLHFPNGCPCKYTILFNFLANTPSERST